MSTEPSNKGQELPKSILSKLLGPIVFLVMLVFKFFPMLLKFGKFSSLLTMFLSVWVYSLAFGWPFAAGFVGLIFIHELGHALALKRLGIPAGAPVFIPFMGAFITMKGLPRDAWNEAVVGIAGPLLGGFGALAVYLLGTELNSHLLIALAQTGFLINLFNMLPVSPMDGGRIIGGVSKWLLVLGFAVGVYFYLISKSPLLLVMLFLGGFHLYQLYKNPVPGYYEISMDRKVTMGLSYLTLLGCLFYFYGLSAAQLKALDQNLQTTVWQSQALAFSSLVMRGIGSQRARNLELPHFFRTVLLASVCHNYFVSASRSFVSQRGMETYPVVEHLNPFKNRSPCL